LGGRFHPDCPDDIQVLIHDGGPRRSPVPPEVVWVRVHGHEDGVYRGSVLNEPQRLTTVKQGQDIGFILADNCPHLLYVTDHYLRERGKWKIRECDKCGFAELFDPPDVLSKVLFPTAPGDFRPLHYTTFCPLCGGVQTVSALGAPALEGSQKTEQGTCVYSNKWFLEEEGTTLFEKIGTLVVIAGVIALILYFWYMLG
jgi:hypothetical protein